MAHYPKWRKSWMHHSQCHPPSSRRWTPVPHLGLDLHLPRPGAAPLADGCGGVSHCHPLLLDSQNADPEVHGSTPARASRPSPHAGCTFIRRRRGQWRLTWAYDFWLSNYLVLSCFLLASKTLLAQSFMQGGNMENLMVIRVEVIAPEKPLLSKHLQK